MQLHGKQERGTGGALAQLVPRDTRGPGRRAFWLPATHLTEAVTSSQSPSEHLPGGWGWRQDALRLTHAKNEIKKIIQSLDSRA